MDRRLPGAAKRRGRPSKFGRPSRIVTLTLPEDAVDRLRRIHRDLGWAIMKLLDQESPRAAKRNPEAQPDVELVTVAERRSLIVVNREVIRSLPGVNIIPLSGTRAFLALDINRGMSDLELAVTDRLAEPALEPRERQALVKLRRQLTVWRRDHELQFHTRAIFVVERVVKSPSDGDSDEAGARAIAARRASAKVWAQLGTLGVLPATRAVVTAGYPERSPRVDDPVTSALLAELSTIKSDCVELHDADLDGPGRSVGLSL